LTIENRTEGTIVIENIKVVKVASQNTQKHVYQSPIAIILPKNN
jgi:hypothetical protein